MLTTSYWDGIFIYIVWTYVKLIKFFSLANGTWYAVSVPSFDFVKGDCAVGSAILGKRGYNLSSTQSMVRFHVKPTEKKVFWADRKRSNGFSMVCVMLQAVYTTAEKEFRTIVFLTFDGSCWHKKAPIRHKRWNNMIFHPVHYKGKGLQSRGLF